MFLTDKDFPAWDFTFHRSIPCTICTFTYKPFPIGHSALLLNILSAMGSAATQKVWPGLLRLIKWFKFWAGKGVLGLCLADGRAWLLPPRQKNLICYHCQIYVGRDFFFLTRLFCPTYAQCITRVLLIEWVLLPFMAYDNNSPNVSLKGTICCCSVYMSINSLYYQFTSAIPNPDELNIFTLPDHATENWSNWSLWHHSLTELLLLATLFWISPDPCNCGIDTDGVDTMA